MAGPATGLGVRAAQGEAEAGVVGDRDRRRSPGNDGVAAGAAARGRWWGGDPREQRQDRPWPGGGRELAAVRIAVAAVAGDGRAAEPATGVAARARHAA